MGSIVSRVTAVITCMTDAERPFVDKAVRSVLAQTESTRLIVSVTEQNTWISDLLPDDERVDLLRMPLSPLGVVRNTALQHVRTDLVGFLDGDDAWRPTKVAKQVALLEKHHLDLLGSRHVLIREDDQRFFYAFAQHIPMPSSWLGRTEVFRAQPFSSRHVGEDVQLWFEMQQKFRCGIADDFLLEYRVRRGSLSQDTDSMRRKLEYERRSYTPGARRLLLLASYAASRALEVRSRLDPRSSRSGAVTRVR